MIYNLPEREKQEQKNLANKKKQKKKIICWDCEFYSQFTCKLVMYLISCNKLSSTFDSNTLSNILIITLLRCIVPISDAG